MNPGESGCCKSWLNSKKCKKIDVEERSQLQKIRKNSRGCISALLFIRRNKISCTLIIDFIVTRPLIAHLSLYTRMKPTCDKKIGITGLVYIFNQWALNYGARGPWFKPWWPFDFQFFFHFLTLNKKNDRNINKNIVRKSQ